MSRKTTDNVNEAVEATEEAVKTETTYDAKYWEERVDWIVPMDMSNPTDNTYLVQVNGRYFKMQRGATVNVPRYVIEQYNQQQAQLLSQLQTDQKFAKQTTDMG